MLSAHKDKVGKLDLIDITNEFWREKDRRKNVLEGFLTRYQFVTNKSVVQKVHNFCIAKYILKIF